jgi:hypothetical protein
MYSNCLRTLICCGWAYGSILILLHQSRLGLDIDVRYLGGRLEPEWWCNAKMSRLKPPVGCIPHPYDKHAKCLSTLTCCWWAYYESTLTLRYPPESEVNFQEFQGGDQPIWCGYIMVEPQTTFWVLHKSISYIYKVFLHLDKLWMGIWDHPQPDTPT